MDEDIAGPIGLEDKKLLLFDDFTVGTKAFTWARFRPK